MKVLKVLAISVAAVTASCASAGSPDSSVVPDVDSLVTFPPAACGQGEHQVVVWSEDIAPTENGWCLIYVKFGSSTTVNEATCLRADVQRWSDWPGCPGAQLLEAVREIRPTPMPAEETTKPDQSETETQK